MDRVLIYIFFMYVFICDRKYLFFMLQITEFGWCWQGVRGLLAATTDILVSYDGFDVRQMVRVANSLLEHLKIARQVCNISQRRAYPKKQLLEMR